MHIILKLKRIISINMKKQKSSLVYKMSRAEVLMLKGSLEFTILWCSLHAELRETEDIDSSPEAIQKRHVSVPSFGKYDIGIFAERFKQIKLELLGKRKICSSFLIFCIEW